MEAEMYRELAFFPEVEFEIRIADNSNEAQIQQIQEMVDRGIDLLIIAPNETEPLTPIVEKVYQSGIPVILIDRKTESELYTAYIGADNYEIGKMAGDYVASTFNGKGKILEIQMSMNISPAVDRHRGFLDAITSYPALEIIDKLEIPFGIGMLDSSLPALLQKYPEIDIVFAHTDLLAEQAHKVAARLGKADSLFFVGVDGIPGTGRGIQAVEDGVLNASLLYPTGGSEAIRLALSILNNLPYEKQNVLQTTVIDPGNARILHFQMKKVASLQRSIDNQISQIQTLDGIFRNQRIFIFILVSSLLLTLILGAFLWKSLRTKQRINHRLEKKNREVLEKQKQIVQMSEEVRLVTQAKFEFFTNISHEFRTPLTLILGFAEDLQPATHFPKYAQEGIRLIQENANRLLRLVNQLMDFRKLESGNMKVQATEKDLIPFVQNIMHSYRKTAEKRDIDFRLVSRHKHLPLWFDEDMIDKVLFNLLSNAFKFTADGGKIHIIVSKDRLENCVKIQLEDNGAGMTAEDASHVFERFYQGDERQKKGTGIGLPLSRALVELHHGTLSLQTTQGKGSRFTISIPLGNSHFEAKQLFDAQVSPTSQSGYLPDLTESIPFLADSLQNSSPQDQKLLIIEDNTDLQYFLMNKLQQDFEILQATDGDDGLQLAFDHIPDLIICDITLPGADGLTITRTLKTDIRTSHIPIVLLTARSSLEQQIEGTEAGADSYLIKPFHFQYLKEKIRNLLYNRRILRENHQQELVSFPEYGHLSKMDQEFIQKFLTYIQANYQRYDLQVTDLSEEMNLSRSQLYRKVKSLLGESINEVIQQTRLSRAEILLSESDLSISEIAYQVGYTSPDYFTTVFKSKYNVVPSQYRKQGK